METNVFGLKQSKKEIIIEKLYINPEDIINLPETTQV